MSSIPEKLSIVAQGVRKAWLLAGATILFVLLFEGCARVLFVVRDAVSDPYTGWCDQIKTADAYLGATWPAEYCDEHMSIAMEWTPYTYWHRQKREAKHINIDEQSLRRTWNRPRGECGTDPTRVFVFGGSTIWGPAVRDAYTVPSHLSKLLADAEQCVEVLNLGETGYVSTQELILLIRRLQAEDVPDLVVFYDGVNELFSAFQNNQAGLPQNEDHRRKEFNFLLDPARVRNAYLGQLLRPEGLSRLQAAVQSRLRPEAVGGAGLQPTQAGLVSELDHEDELITGMLQVYKSNLDMVRALADHYGFDALFYWQPMIFTKQSVSDYERQWVDVSAGQWKDFLMAAYGRVEQDADLRGATDFRNVAGIFDALPDPYYVDAFHLTEDGNRVVADVIATDVVSLLSASAPGL